jgi:hypothetical protein
MLSNAQQNSNNKKSEIQLLHKSAGITSYAQMYYNDQYEIQFYINVLKWSAFAAILKCPSWP